MGPGGREDRLIMTKKSYQSIILSDLHLSDAEPEHPKNPLWKLFRQKQFYIDQEFEGLLDQLLKQVEGPIELILNGDIFDFDSVMSLPENGEFPYSAHERRRGLDSGQHKSVFKIQKILEDHNIWVDALKRFLDHGHRIVFIIGNHDLELHWPKVQKKLIRTLGRDENECDSVVFCEWFYICGDDTLVEHGNQYDPYCLCANPINPLIIKKRKKIIVRLPFGNLANKYMVNGMGLKNPHSDQAYVMNLWGFVKYFFKYEVKVQPLLIWTWFTGALRTFFVYTLEGWLPPIKDPLSIEARIAKMAEKANSTPQKIRLLREFHAHPAAYKPFMVLRELWLDRAFFLIFILWGCFQFYSTSNLIIDVSGWWFFVPVFLCLPFFTYYASGVFSDVRAHAKEAEFKIPQLAKAMEVKRVIQGHTHILANKLVGDVQYINTGAWTPLFHDAECSKAYGRKPFAWITQNADGTSSAELHQWKDGKIIKIEQL